MPKFKYVAVAGDGSETVGIFDAADRAGVGTALLERGLSLRTITEKKSLLQFEITRKRVPRKELMHFSRQLSAFLKAGVAILDSIETIESEMANKLFRAVLVDMVASVRGGSTFAAAAQAHPEAFPPVYLAMLESAELTGNLDSVLDRLSEYVERELEAKRKVKAALMYPGVVAGMSVATVAVLAGFVLPRF